VLTTPGPAILAHGGGGEELPPPLTAGRLLTSWEAAWVPILGVLLVGGLYLYGVWRLRRRGDHWPVGRTLLFVGLGLGSFLVATTSVLAVYDDTLFWIHMVQHMVLAMLTPVFLALGAPITLALRTLPAGGRQALLGVLHSRVAKVLTYPVVAGVLFVATPFALYLTGWYEATLRHPFLHELNHLHFVVIGALWFWPLLGPDPMPNRIPYPMRLIAVFATMPFHAFLGVAIMSQSTLIAGDWYLGLDRHWGPTPLQDQHLGGGVLWASGDLVALVVLGALFLQWARASEREAVREDRRLDRLDAQRERAAIDALDPQAAAERAVEGR
jgi:cytochrome c oxidase assembly factor CtaG